MVFICVRFLCNLYDIQGVLQEIKTRFYIKWGHEMSTVENLSKGKMYGKSHKQGRGTPEYLFMF